MSNATHHKRLARRFATKSGRPYAAALELVRKAAAAGRLTEPLDAAGMDAALERLLEMDSAAQSGDSPATATSTPIRMTGWERRVRLLRETVVAALADEAQVPSATEIIERTNRATDARRTDYRRQGLHVGLGDYATLVTNDSWPGFACLGCRSLAEGKRDGEDGSISWTMTGDTPCPQTHEHVEQDPTPAQVFEHEGHQIVILSELLKRDAQASSARSLYLIPSSLGLLRMAWQGRVTKEVTGRNADRSRFAIDNEPASTQRDLELALLERDGYIEARLVVSEEWVVARTTDFGDEVLAANGADVDKFRDGLPTGAGLDEVARALGHASTAETVRHYLDEADRNPYVGEGADGARRSAEIDRSEADGLDQDDSRRAEVLASAERWDRQAERLEQVERAQIRRQVEHDPDTGEWVGSEWIAKPGDRGSDIQVTDGPNPRFDDEHAARAWAAGEPGSGDVVKPLVSTAVLAVAHDDARCTGSSWRSAPQKRRGGEYGPGMYNRCVKAAGHHPSEGGTDPHHLDEWGNVFLLDGPNGKGRFKAVRTVTNAEMTAVAREQGRFVGTGFEPEFGRPEPTATPSGHPIGLPRRGTLWMTEDGEMVQVSEHYENDGADDSDGTATQVSGQVVYPVPPRTTVRFYSVDEVTRWVEPTKAQMKRYEKAWGFAD